MILLAWLGPNAVFWGWYFLSLNDISFGTIFLSRTLHDQVFSIYGGLLGLDPAVLPGLLARALLFDSALIVGIVVLRRRRKIFGLLRRLRAGRRHVGPPAPSTASLSSAP